MEILIEPSPEPSDTAGWPHQREKLIEKKWENQVSVCWRGVVVVTRVVLTVEC